MPRVPYVTIGGLGALLGVNIGASLMKLPIERNLVAGNHIAEAVIIIAIVGILYEFIKQGSFWRKPQGLSILAILVGGVWQWVTFLGGWSWAIGGPVLVDWIKYGVPTILFIGFPVIWISTKLSRRQRIGPIHTVNSAGLVFTFFTGLIIGLIGLKMMVTVFETIYGWFGGVFF